jgi:hypothetical protein
MIAGVPIREPSSVGLWKRAGEAPRTSFADPRGNSTAIHPRASPVRRAARIQESATWVYFGLPKVDIADQGYARGFGVMSE